MCVCGTRSVCVTRRARVTQCACAAVHAWARSPAPAAPRPPPPPGTEAPSPPVSAHRRGRELPGRKRAAGRGGGTPRPSPPAQRRGPLCPSPPCLLCAAGTGIFHLPAPAGPDLRSGARSRLCPRGAPGASPGPGPLLAGAGGGERGLWGRRGEGWSWRLWALETCPCRGTLPALSCLCTSERSGASLRFPCPGAVSPAGTANSLKVWGAVKGVSGEGAPPPPRCGCASTSPASHVSVKASSPAGGSTRPRPLPDTRGDTPRGRESGRVGPGRAGWALPGGGVAAAPRGRTGSPPAAL